MSVESVLSRAKVHCGEETRGRAGMKSSSCDTATNRDQLFEWRALMFFESWRDI